MHRQSAVALDEAFDTTEPAPEPTEPGPLATPELEPGKGRPDTSAARADILPCEYTTMIQLHCDEMRRMTADEGKRAEKTSKRRHAPLKPSLFQRL